MTTATPSIPVFARWFGSWQITVQRRALSVPQLTRRYDASANSWQRTVACFGFPAAFESLLRRVAGADRPATVLDFGVGTGALSPAPAAKPGQHGPQASLTVTPQTNKRFIRRSR